MPTWHQEHPGKPLPKLTHPTLWRSYNPTGHLSVMTHASQDECIKYCEHTGEVPLPPDNHRAPALSQTPSQKPVEVPQSTVECSGDEYDHEMNGPRG